MRMTELVLASLFVVGLALSVGAAEKKNTKAEGAKEGDKVVILKPESLKRAKFVDFAGSLGVSLSSLDSLGDRIDNARLASDPIELAIAAQLLAAAEAVSEKKAGLTSDALLQEAAALADLRKDPTELKTLAKLIGGKIGTKLQQSAKAAVDEQPTKGEDTRDLYGTLIVDNRANHGEVHVYVNGREVGHVGGHGIRSFHVHHGHVLEARDHYGHRWHQHVTYHTHRYWFRLNPPHHHH